MTPPKVCPNCLGPLRRRGGEAHVELTCYRFKGCFGFTYSGKPEWGEEDGIGCFAKLFLDAHLGIAQFEGDNDMYLCKALTDKSIPLKDFAINFDWNNQNDVSRLKEYAQKLLLL